MTLALPLASLSRGDWISLAYLVAIVCFILALRFLSNPARARKGNLDRRVRDGGGDRRHVLPARA